MIPIPAIAVTVACVIFLLSSCLNRTPGKKGFKILTKIFGPILVAIAMQFFIDDLPDAPQYLTP